MNNKQAVRAAIACQSMLLESELFIVKIIFFSYANMYAFSDGRNIVSLGVPLQQCMKCTALQT